MKNLIIVFFTALSFCSCDDIPDDDIVDCGKITNVAYESFYTCSTLKEEPVKLSYMIFNSAEEFSKVFIPCPTLLPVEFPDLAGKRILGLFAGQKTTGGYDIKIQSVVEDDCQIVVQYFEKEPKPDDLVTTVLTSPKDFILLPKSSKPIFFKRVNEITDYVIIGRYSFFCPSNCSSAYRIDNIKTMRLLEGNNYQGLGVKEDLPNFISHIPQEILDLKGQSKEFVDPNIADGGGCYFEFHQGDKVTKINFTNFYSTDPSHVNLIKFKNYINERITFLEGSK